MRRSLLAAAALSGIAGIVIDSESNAALAQAADSQEVKGAEVALWQGFKFGMNPDDVVRQLLTRADVKKAKYKIKNGHIEFDINYVGSGVDLFSNTFRMVFDFDGNSLSAVKLFSSYRNCYSAREESYKKFYAAIREKYGNVLLENDGGRTLVAGNDRVRVTLALVDHKMPSLPLPPRQNPALANTIDWQYTFAKAEYDRIVKEREDRLYQCQSDIGRMASIAVIYQDEEDQRKKDTLRLQMREQKKIEEQGNDEKESEKL